MKQNTIIKLIAQQVFYLFDTNHMVFLLPDSEARLLSSNHSRVRNLFEQIFTAAKNQSFIDEKMKLWDFVELIRNDFKALFDHRVKLLKASGYANDFVYPDEHDKFLLKGNFNIIESTPVKITRVQPLITETEEREEPEETAEIFKIEHPEPPTRGIDF